MNFEKLKAFVELTRPVNCLIALLSIVAASILAGGRGDAWVEIFIAGLVGALVAAGANAINDYFDVEIDRINRPERPIPRNAIQRNEARLLWFALSMIGLGLNFFLPKAALGITLFAVIGLYLYSLNFKKSVLVGNILVALMTGLAFVYGAVVIGKTDKAIMPAVFAFLINLARELVKDVEDLEGDKRQSAMTLPVKYGARRAIITTTIVLLVLVGATLGAYSLNMYNSTYLYIVLVVDLLLVYTIASMWKDMSSPNLGKLSTLLKLNMVLGLFAIFFGSN